MKALALVLLASLVLFGCIQAPGGNASPTPIEDLLHEDLNATASPTPVVPDTTGEETAINQGQEAAAEVTETGDVQAGELNETDAAAPDEADGAQAAPNEPAQNAAADSTANATVQHVQFFAVEMDDGGFYPDAITVTAGEPVNLTLHLRSQNVYYGGADVKSAHFTELGFQPGEARSVLFTADTTFTATETWPTSGVIKGILTVNVNQGP
ncbi:MAG: hypothetical protein Q8P02_05390 [Candidatus Micrarchaeota archaeon]|nr:hypothetical protein [Candidatus Micrarchaeota archaeon]